MLIGDQRDATHRSGAFRRIQRPSDPSERFRFPDHRVRLLVTRCGALAPQSPNSACHRILARGGIVREPSGSMAPNAPPLRPGLPTPLALPLRAYAGTGQRLRRKPGATLWHYNGGSRPRRCLTGPASQRAPCAYRGGRHALMSRMRLHNRGGISRPSWRPRNNRAVVLVVARWPRPGMECPSRRVALLEKVPCPRRGWWSRRPSEPQLAGTPSASANAMS